VISIIIDNYNRSYLLSLIMKAYSRDQVDEDVEMIIVDDSSDTHDHFIDYLKIGLDAVRPWFKVKAFKMPFECSNMNVGRTLNIGVKQSQGDLLILNHSDMIPLNRDVLKLVREEHQKEDWLYLTSRFISVDYPMRDVIKPEERDWVLTPGSSMPRKLFDAVGGFDERFRGYGPVEPDLAWRIIYAPKEHGFTHKRSKEITFLHFKMAKIPIRSGEPSPENDKLALENRGRVRVNPDGWGSCENLERVELTCFEVK